MIKVGDKVRRKHDDFIFDGVVLAEIISKSGRRLLAVEQEGTGMVQCFYENMIYADDGFGWVDRDPEHRPVAVAPPPKIQLPVDIFVPLKAIPAAGANRKSVTEKIRERHLIPHAFETLVTEEVCAEVEFHFIGKRSGDIDNLLKPTLDLLKGSIIRDDSQIMQLSSKMVEKAPQDGFRVKLTKYAPEG